MTPEQAAQIRERNRRAHPRIARMVDEWRKFFPEMQVVSITRRTKEEAEAIKGEWRKRATLSEGSSEPRE